MCLLGILQIHPERFIDAQVILRDVAEEFAFGDGLVSGAQGGVLGVGVGLQLQLLGASLDQRDGALVGRGVPDVVPVQRGDIGAAEEA